MTVRTKLAALRMKEIELLKTPCARCGHRLGGHSVVQRNCIGADGKQCSCRDFVDPGEKLNLDG